MKKLSVILILALLLPVFAGCNNIATGAGQQTAGLSKEDAQQAALAHANLSADAVTALRAEYDFDDGVPQWEVDFRNGDWEYDYTIHAETGEILKTEKDYID